MLSTENKRQFLFLACPHTVFLFSLILQNLAANAMMSTIPMMKAASCEMIPLSGSSGLCSMAIPSSIQPRSF